MKTIKKNDIITYDKFIVGRSNMSAYNLSKKLINNITMTSFLLFISGPVGCGKSHLLYELSSCFEEKYPHESSKIISVRTLIDDYICTLKAKDENLFYKKYVGNKLLLIDDFHYVAGLINTQEMLCDVFETFVNAGISIIITSEYEIGMFEGVIHFCKTGNNFYVTNIKRADRLLRKKKLKIVLDKRKVKLNQYIFRYIVSNEKILLSSFDGLISKIKLKGKVERHKLTSKEILDLIKVYER